MSMRPVTFLDIVYEEKAITVEYCWIFNQPVVQLQFFAGGLF